jgi:hypothetical protein
LSGHPSFFYRSIFPANVFSLSADSTKKSYAPARIKCAATQSRLMPPPFHSSPYLFFRHRWSFVPKEEPGRARLSTSEDAGGRWRTLEDHRHRRWFPFGIKKTGNKKKIRKE